jgi:hypothetical protein
VVAGLVVAGAVVGLVRVVLGAAVVGFAVVTAAVVGEGALVAKLVGDCCGNCTIVTGAEVCSPHAAKSPATSRLSISNQPLFLLYIVSFTFL